MEIKELISLFDHALSLSNANDRLKTDVAGQIAWCGLSKYCATQKQKAFHKAESVKNYFERDIFHSNLPAIATILKKEHDANLPNKALKLHKNFYSSNMSNEEVIAIIKELKSFFESLLAMRVYRFQQQQRRHMQMYRYIMQRRGRL